MNPSIKLSSKDHQNMDRFLEMVLDAYKAGDISRASAVGGLAHVMAALAIGNDAEAISWFKKADLTYFKD